MSFIDVKGLVKKYKTGEVEVTAIDDVSFEVEKGEMIGIVGASGTGKSTLIKVMAGLIQPDSGTRAVQKDCRITYLPQSGLTHNGCTLKEEADKADRYQNDNQYCRKCC